MIRLRGLFCVVDGTNGTITCANACISWPMPMCPKRSHRYIFSKRCLK